MLYPLAAAAKGDETGWARKGDGPAVSGWQKRRNGEGPPPKDGAGERFPRPKGEGLGGCRAGGEASGCVGAASVATHCARLKSSSWRGWAAWRDQAESWAHCEQQGCRGARCRLVKWVSLQPVGRGGSRAPPAAATSATRTTRRPRPGSWAASKSPSPRSGPGGDARLPSARLPHPKLLSLRHTLEPKWLEPKWLRIVHCHKIHCFHSNDIGDSHIRNTESATRSVWFTLAKP